ncbi:MAG: hypothetical protein QOK39_1145 [Acidimicrobiaceae bacterium]|nr:hypothetical protein [Acidimicrobiaceae bacterium]
MRVAFNTLHEDPAAPSNAVRFIANMVTALAERTPANEYLLYVGEQGVAMFDDIAPPSVRRQVFPHSNERRLQRMIAEQRDVPGRLRADKVDIFHCVGGVVPFRSDVPSALSVITMHHKLFPRQIGFARTQFRNVMFDLSVRKATVIICNSESNKANILKYLPVSEDKTMLCPDALDEFYLKPADPVSCERLRAELHIDKPYIMFASALWKYKGLETLLDAFALLRKSDGEARQLVVCGSGWPAYTEELKSKADRLGIAADTLWVGHQGAERLRSIYAGAEVFVYPSLYETFGHPPLQAMAQGAPVVASDCSSIPEVVGDAALLFDPHSPQELHDALRRLLDNPAFRQEMIDRGRRQAQVWNWDRASAAVVDVYARCS